MKKKWIVILSVTMCVIITVITLMFTLFTVTNVKLEFRTSLYNINQDEKSIIQSAKINYGSTIFFQNKNIYKDNLEKFNPYIKVINIESKIPNSLIIHIAEREEQFAVKNQDKTYIFDDDFKLLKIVSEFSSTQENAILLNIDCGSELEVGQTLDISSNALKYLTSSLMENNRTRKEQKAMFKEINISSRYEPTTKKDEECIELIDFNGYKIVIYNAKKDLTGKLQKALGAYCMLNPDQIKSTYIYVADLYDGGFYFSLENI